MVVGTCFFCNAGQNVLLEIWAFFLGSTERGGFFDLLLFFATVASISSYSSCSDFEIFFLRPFPFYFVAIVFLTLAIFFLSSDGVFPFSLEHFLVSLVLGLVIAFWTNFLLLVLPTREVILGSSSS